MLPWQLVRCIFCINTSLNIHLLNHSIVLYKPWLVGVYARYTIPAAGVRGYVYTAGNKTG